MFAPNFPIELLAVKVSKPNRQRPEGDQFDRGQEDFSATKAVFALNLIPSKLQAKYPGRIPPGRVSKCMC
jgi:hypothetical protein